MRVLVTGASGFVGRNLLPKLLVENHAVAILVRSESKILSSATKEISLKNKDWKLEISKFQPEVVIHLASFLTSEDHESAINTLVDSNILFGTHLLDALKEVELKYFINIGSFSEYHNGRVDPIPAYLYAATKTAFKSIVSYYQSLGHFKFIHVVPYTIYGGADSQKKIVDHIYEATLQGITKQMSLGEQKLDFIHIDDVTRFFVVLLEHLGGLKLNFTEIHLGTGKGTSLREMANMVTKITGEEPDIEWGALPYRKRDTMYAVADRNLPSEYFPWQADTSLEDGLKKYIEKKNNELSES